jgi:hypothetical protein
VGLLGRRSSSDRADEDQAHLDSTHEETDHVVEGTSARESGPWDVADDYPEASRVDLGALRVPQGSNVRIQVQADPNTGVVTQVSLMTSTSAAQLQPYAAPRSGGMWQDVRKEISSQINKSGGLVEQAEGPFGVELRAQVAGQDGKNQPARFCGIDGPRWFLRVVFLGQAARDASAAEPLEDAVRDVVVVRGGDAMPMGNALPMRVPADAIPTQEEQAPTEGGSDAADQKPELPKLTLPERGPEITEIR